jgi:hypothetical protein
LVADSFGVLLFSNKRLEFIEHNDSPLYFIICSI